MSTTSEEFPHDGTRALPATPLDASFPLALVGPVVVRQVLHGQRVLAEGSLILAVLPPNLFKVPHCRHKERDGQRKTFVYQETLSATSAT